MNAHVQKTHMVFQPQAVKQLEKTHQCFRSWKINVLPVWPRSSVTQEEINSGQVGKDVDRQGTWGELKDAWLLKEAACDGTYL